VRKPEVLPEIYELRPWYHDFGRLGLKTDFGDVPAPAVEKVRTLLSTVRQYVLSRRRGERKVSLRRALSPQPSSHRVNQRHKEVFLLPFLERCLGELDTHPRCLELFCADGYYSCVMSRMKPGAFVTGVDRDRREIERARTAARLLGCRQASFVVEDVWSFVERTEATFDLILCAGGLYHLTEPRRLLELLRRRAARFLVIQSVVTLEVGDAGYFVTPAPGWKHGSRFTHARLESWLTDLGWRILASGRNELTANARPCDRGSSYFLCLAPAAQP